MRLAILEALPTLALVTAEAFALAAVVGWLVLVPFTGLIAAKAAAPLVGLVGGAVGGGAFGRHALRVGRPEEG